MKKDKELKEKIVAEYLSGGTSFRILGMKYGYAGQSICEWVMEFRGRKRVRKKSKPRPQVEVAEELPKEVKLLQEELRKSKLRNKLLEEVILLNQEETGVDLIKKAGTKRS